MKVELFIDPATNLIVGYREVSLNPSPNKNDAIYVDSLPEDMDILRHRYYYENDSIVMDDSRQNIFNEIQSVEDEYYRYMQLVSNEGHVFMDHIISGKSVDEAREICARNREKCKELEERVQEINNLRRSQSYAAYQSKTHKYYVSILLLIKDENEYLEEWLEYYIDTLAVDHIYIYDNESAEPVKDFLTHINYPNMEKLTILTWNTTNDTQKDAYDHFLKTYAHETKWMATIDSDEFVTMRDSSMSLKYFLKEHEQYALIKCTWHTYGANGHIRKTEGRVQDRFPNPVVGFALDDQGKDFVQPELISHYVRHTPIMKTGCISWREIGEIDKIFYLKHYYTKSYEEWCKKIFARGSCDPNARWNFQIFFIVNPDLIHIYDGRDFIQTFTEVSKNDNVE